MVRIHAISIRRIKSRVLITILMIIIFLLTSKLTWMNTRDMQVDLKPKTENIPKYFKEQSIDSNLYIKVLEQTIPYVDEYSNDGHTSKSISEDAAAFLSGIRFNELSTIIEQIIPLSGYINNKSTQYTQNIIEVQGTFDEYKKEVVNQNDEDFYKIDDDVFDTFNDPFATETKYTKAQLTNIDFLKRTLYNFEGNLNLSYADVPVVKLMNKQMAIDQQPSKPQILIFHTHSQENFIDSTPNKLDEGVIGLGEELAKILHEKYGVGVLHHKGQYDVVNGKLMRDGSYERVEPAIRKILKENPSIEVVIDLHRDGIESGKLITKINGEPTAKIMFVNGICKKMENGKLTDLSYLPNPYLQENLAFSLQMQLKGNELYPGFLRKIYIKPYRYSLNMMPKSLLIEVGANTNTLEEARNAMEPLAKILSEVLDLE